MAEKCLVIRCAGRPKDIERLLGSVSDYADEQFEVYTSEHGRPMGLVSWLEPADQQQKLHVVLAEILEWYDGLPNDMFDTMPLAIKRACKLIPQNEK